MPPASEAPLAADPQTPDLGGKDVRPASYDARQFLTIAIVLGLLAAYFNWGEHLPVPGAFGSVDKRSGQVTFNSWMYLATITTGFYLVFGIAGRFAFSTASFVALGAYVSHYSTSSGNNWFVGFVAATLLAAVLGLAFATLVRNAHHFYFAVATLGLAEILLLVFTRWQRLVGRPGGEIQNVQDVSVFGYEFDSRYRHFYLWLALLAIVLVVTALIERSPLRRQAIAARDNPTVSETVGVDTHWPGIVLFTLGCVIAAAAGSVFVHTRGLGTPDSWGLNLGIGIFVILILGGLHSMFGALIGAWFYIYMPDYLERWEEWTQVIWGLVLVGVMVLVPDGLVGLWRHLRRGGERLAERRLRVLNRFLPPEQRS